MRARGLVAAIAALAVMLVMLVPVQAATAAPGDIETSVQIVSNPDGVPVTELRGPIDDRSTTRQIMGLQIGYSCGGTSDCVGTTIKIDPMQLDPYYGTHRFASYRSFTPPPGATISGNATAGYTVVLGTVASGFSGTFRVLYTFQDRGVGVSDQSFFPDGFPVTVSATIAATGLDPVTRSTTVPWHIDTPEPAVGFATTPVARVDQDFTYTLFMSARCLWERSTAGHGEPAFECAESYETVQTLPAGAVYVSASHDGSYSAAAGTVTWAASGVDAATGWGSLNSLGTPRTVTVRFPQSMFTDPDECVISVTSALHVDMTYLSGATDSADATRTHEVNACTPFASGALEKFVTRNTGTTADPIVWEGTTTFWTARVIHRSNVPAVATIVDNNLDQAGLPVTRVVIPVGSGTITATLDNGEAVTVTSNQYTAPSGRRIVAATVVSDTILGPNKVVGNQALSTTYAVRYYFTVQADVPDEGYQRTNTASASLEFPGTPELSTYSLGSASETVTALPRPAVLTPRISRTVVGGGNPVAGTVVQYSVNADTSYQEPGVAFEPQYVFVAPEQWTIIPGSAGFASLPDATIEYKTVVIDGVTRDAVFAARPAGTVWGVNATWPVLNVQATPTASAPASSTGRATFYMGDAGHNYGPTTALWGANNAGRLVDAPDLDGDGDVTESFAFAHADTLVGAASALRVLKEICLPDSSAADECAWLSDSSLPVGVSPDTTNITYRITISNAGSTALTGVVAYDVLPHIGDMGTSASQATTPRGSTFDESLNTVGTIGAGLTLTYSESTNPCRPEVYPGAPACVDDWSGVSSGASAIRATLAGSLTAGQSVSFVYTASVVGTPAADALACNSVAADTLSTPSTEPQPVCALIESADLSISVPDRLPLQAGRPGVLPFEVLNVSGTAEAGGVVGFDIPAGLTVTSLDIDGWDCTSTAGTAPLAGPARIECVPIDEFGAERTFAVGVSELIGLPVIPAAAVAQLCVPADIDGVFSDPAIANNTTTGCFAVLAGRPALEISKDDGQTEVAAGDEYSYTIRVANLLAGENVNDVTVTDELPAGLIFVSATGGGVVSGQNAADVFGDLTGGTVTWTIAALGSSGVPSPGGDTGTGAVGSSAEFTVTVRVTPLASGTVENVANAAAVDPSDPAVDLEATASDVDDVIPALNPTVAKTVTSFSQADDGLWAISYAITIVNPNTQVPVAYDVSDALAYGAGVTISSAQVTSAPAGVTPLAWTGSGAIAADVVLAAAATHSYSVDVIADAGTVTGTAAADCVTGVAAGFTNTATATLADASTVSSEVCVTPVEPTIAKSVIGAPVENPDGTITVSYLLTVTNPHAAPASGLAYTLDDSLSFPAGVDVRDIAVTAPGGVTANTGFTGGLAEIDGVAVTADASVIDGISRIPAGSVATPTVQELRVDVTLAVTEGSVDPAELACGAAGTGYGNWVTLFSGHSSTALGEATACADISLPELRFTKAVDRAGSAPAGTTLAYTITAANVGGVAFTSADPARLVDDMTGLLDDGVYNNDAVAAVGTASYSRPVLDWSGPIAAGDSVTIRYTVTLNAANSGDNQAVNLVSRAGVAVPATGVVDCGADAASSTEDFCAVRLAVTAPSLVLTGAGGVNTMILIGILAFGMGGLMLMAASMRRRGRHLLVS